MKLFRQGDRGFSLFEVIIAVGIFGAAITIMLSLLPALVASAAKASDTIVAVRLPDAVGLELQRVAISGGFEALVSEISRLSEPLPATLTLAADRALERVQTLNYLPSMAAEQIPEASRYFLIEVWRFTTPPLEYNARGAGLAVQVRVSWPFFIPGADTVAPLSEREQFVFNLALNR